MSLRRSVAAAVAVATLSTASAASGSPWALKPGEFYSELSGSSLSTSTFYQDSDRARVWLGGTLEQRTVRSHNELGWKKRVSVWFDVPFVSRTYAPGDGGSVTSTGLGDLDFGLRWGIRDGRMPLALELGWVTPLGGNRRLFPGTGGSGGMNGNNQNYNVLAKDAVQDSNTFFSQGLQTLSAALELGGTVGKRAYWTLGGGYRTRFLSIAARDSSSEPVRTQWGKFIIGPPATGPTGRYADFVTGNASLGIWMGRSLLVSGSFAGEWSIGQGDRYDRNSARSPVELESISLLAGPRFTYRMDERMDLFAGSWHTPAGKNVLHADQFYCGIAWKQTGLDRLAGAFGGTQAH